MSGDTPYLERARESLEGAESEYAHRRYHNSANRSYYACFQAAIYALGAEGIHTPRGVGWSHGGLQAAFARHLVVRRKRYPGQLRSILPDLYSLRAVADYGLQPVSAGRAYTALRRAQEFLQAIENRGEPS